MTVPFAGVTDPLSLGSNYECIRASTPEAVELAKIKAATGTHLQEDARIKTVSVSADYFIHTGGTQIAAGSTVNGYLVDSSDVKEGNAEHKTMTVSAHKHAAVSVTSTL